MGTEGSGVTHNLHPSNNVLRLLARLVAHVDRLTALRLLVVGCQAITILITWRLWQVRDDPPLLPAVDLPQFGIGGALLVTLLVSATHPRVGVPAHVVVLLYGFAADQTRLQPEFVSMAILLFGTTGILFSAVLAKAHLVSLWIWNGINKLLSEGFMGEEARWIFEGFPLRVEALRPHFGWFVLGLEILVGASLVFKRTRRMGVLLAVALHVVILVVLSPLGHGANESVWAWNVALPAAAVVFFWPRREEPPARAGSTRWMQVASAAITAVVVAMPIGFYAGYVDAYLAHNLFTGNTATAEICRQVGGQAYDCSRALFYKTWSAFEVPLPPEPRIYTAYFEKACRPGEVLMIHPRRTRLLFGRDTDLMVRRCLT